AFIIGDFGKEVEAELLSIAEGLGAKGHIFYQDEPLGTAHAIWMAESLMQDEIIIAFADTLFVANFKLDRNKDGAIWVKSVDDPSQFGVVTVNPAGVIHELVEKPSEFVSDLAIIGIYYIREGEKLRAEIQHLLDHDLREKGEFQLTNALENMKVKGAQFVPGKVDEWMDCGNKTAVLDTSKRVLNLDSAANKLSFPADLQQENVVIIPPCYFGSGVSLKNSIIGPHVTLGDNTNVCNSVIAMSIIGENSKVDNVVIQESIVGNHALVEYGAKNLDIGDYSRIRE
ncbi:MAG TPA: nucleotidyltransferase, partial [Bacteroidetes bacterium]|nr:nucleotidyltransferase [Bacteroidota bacterium]